MYFFQNIQAEAFFCEKNLSINKYSGILSAKNIFSLLKGKRTKVSMFCTSKQAEPLELDGKALYCSYQTWNRQFSRKKALIRARMRQDYYPKLYTNEFKSLAIFNSCLFTISRGNYFNKSKKSNIISLFLFHVKHNSRETI